MYTYEYLLLVLSLNNIPLYLVSSMIAYPMYLLFRTFLFPCNGNEVIPHALSRNYDRVISTELASGFWLVELSSTNRLTGF